MRKIALSVPVEYEGWTFEVLMPDAVMARLLPAMVGTLARLPGNVQEMLTSDGADGLSPEAASALGPLLLDADLLALVGEAFDAGVIAWQNVEAEDGSPLACSQKNKAYIPLVDKLAVVFAFIGKQQVLAAKKEPAT